MVHTHGPHRSSHVWSDKLRVSGEGAAWSRSVGGKIPEREHRQTESCGAEGGLLRRLQIPGPGLSPEAAASTRAAGGATEAALEPHRCGHRDPGRGDQRDLFIQSGPDRLRPDTEQSGTKPGLNQD